MNLVKVFSTYINIDKEIASIQLTSYSGYPVTTITFNDGTTLVMKDCKPDEVYDALEEARKELNKPKPMLKGPRR